MIHGDFSISNTDTEVTIPILGLTAVGHLIVSLLPSTGGDTIYRTKPMQDEAVISVDSPPGAGNAYNGRWSLWRFGGEPSADYVIQDC